MLFVAKVLGGVADFVGLRDFAVFDVDADHVFSDGNGVRGPALSIDRRRIPVMVLDGIVGTITFDSALLRVVIVPKLLLTHAESLARTRIGKKLIQFEL